MALDFLIKIRTQILNDKLELELKKKNLADKLTENKRYIEKLNQEKEQNFDLFNPRKKVGKLQKDIQALEEKQKEYEKKIEKINREICAANEKLMECDAAIKDAKEQARQYEEGLKEAFAEQPEQIEKEICFKMEPLIFDCNEMKEMQSKLEFCIKLIPSDTMRCRMELLNLLKQLKEAIRKWKSAKEQAKDEE